MHQDSFRSVVCRSLSKNLPSKSKDGGYPETTQCAVPCVVTLQPTVCHRCQDWDWSPSQSNREERSILSHKDYLMASSLSRRFAEDLLRGAMDLQDSLAMLDKFQNASRSMRLANKKRRPEAGDKSPEIAGIRQALLEASNAKKAVPRRSVSNGLDGQSRNSTDELKKVIKDNFYLKNLLSVSNAEKVSMSQPSHYTPYKSSTSKSTEQQKVVPKSFPLDRSSSPSLVAKLMGLDGLPTFNASTVKKDETKKTVSSPRALFDTEMPKVQQNNVRMNFPYSPKGIGPPYGTSVVNDLGSKKTIRREKNIEQTQTRTSKDIKVVSHISRKQQTKETTEMSRRSSDKQKPHSAYRKGDGRNGTNAKSPPASRSNANVLKKPDKKLTVASSSSSSMSRTRSPVVRKTPNNLREKTVSSRNVKNSTIDDIAAYELYREFIQDDGPSPSTEYSATPSDESCQSADWGTEPCMYDIREDLGESNEVSLTTSPAERINPTNGDTFHPPTQRIPTKEAEIKDEMSLLLLSDQSFLTRATELIGIGTHGYLINQYKGISKTQVKNSELYVDMASEQLERKHRKQNSLCRTATYFSLEALLRDIGAGTRKLNSYTDDDGCRTKDTLYMKLEKDLACTNTSINSVWDMGWEDWICMEETQSFVGDVGEGILSMLIEEAALELW